MGKILIVDDSPFMIRLLSYMLETAGYETESAENGKIALELMLKEPPGLVLMDMMMPEMDGLETLRAIRDNVRIKDVTVLTLSAKTQSEDFQAAKGLVADGYLTKSFESAQVLASAARYLGPAPGKEGGNSG